MEQRRKLTVSKPIGRPDRQFYAKSNAFGRFGIRWFKPVVMKQEHYHGHIELNWLSAGSLDYEIDGRFANVPARRIAIFWAGIPHQATALHREDGAVFEQCNVYLPLDAFLHMPHLEPLQDALMGGAIISLDPDSIGENTLRRWYGDYRSGDPERQDILRVELSAMLRRAVLIGWQEILSPWIESGPSGTRHGAPVRYVVAMVRHILENLTEPLSVENVAEIVDLHPNYALKLFSDVMRVPIRKFVVRMRLVRARVLLFESNLSIANVAYQSGFNSLSQFYSHFSKAYGVTPLELRKQFIR